MLTLLMMLIPSLSNAGGDSSERIWLDAQVNGKPARLPFDTGADISALWKRSLPKFELEIVPFQKNHLWPEFVLGETPECALTLEGAKWKDRFLVVHIPGYANPDFDGVIGWSTLDRNVMEIDARARKVSFLDEVPKRATRWPRFSLTTNSGTLDLVIPHCNQTNGILCIDTGSASGVELPRDEWRRWKEANQDERITLGTAFTPSDGFFVFEEAWADKITIGPITFTDVPVSRAGTANSNRFGARYKGTLGMAALKRLNFIVDGVNGVAYLRTNNSRLAPYSYNRLGAVFVPATDHENQGVAHVIKGGPAYEAGVRDGDVLVKVDDVAATRWTTEWLKRFNLPAGTKLRLTLERDGKGFETTATLRELLQPKPKREVTTPGWRRRFP
jgi:hypothetical protein